jgi:uncharacterized paraquat-inducible protein A
VVELENQRQLVCNECAALTTLPGFRSIEAFICRECRQGVPVKKKLQ